MNTLTAGFLTFQWKRYAAAVGLVILAAALRVWPLGVMGTRVQWLTFYPAVMAAAVYGGFFPGMFATVLACLSAAYFWPLFSPEAFIVSFPDWVGLGVFLLNGVMISAIAEGMLRANVRARKALEQAEAANRAKSVFLASMSHELRTPLNAVLGFSSMLRDDKGINPEQRKTLDIINRSGDHLLNLINSVLDMAKVDAGKLVVEEAPVDLGELVLEAMDLMRVRAEEKKLQLLLDQTSDFPRFVRTDGGKLRQMILNLLGNAIKFTETGGVTLRLNARPDRAEGRLLLILEVEDSGIGISPADQVRVFEPFFQAAGNVQQKGTGLGLAIVKQYAELLRGSIALESEPGSGTIVRLELPVKPASEKDITGVAINPGRVTGLVPGQPKYRILIVEDQMENWLLLKRLLEGVGVETRVAEDGVAGVEAFKEWHPHFICMDVRLPVIDGLEAARRIRALDGGNAVKIAALTASVFKEQRDEVLAAGMDDFIRKPYRPEEIFNCLERHLGVRFVYEEALKAEPGSPSIAVKPVNLAGLPAELRQSLRTALTSLDSQRISCAIEEIDKINPGLGKDLSSRAFRLEYSNMLAALNLTSEKKANGK